jgi:hypothetical protein
MSRDTDVDGIKATGFCREHNLVECHSCLSQHDPSTVFIRNRDRVVLTFDLPADDPGFDPWWRPFSDANGWKVQIVRGQHGPVVAEASVKQDEGPFWMTDAKPTQEADDV